MATPLIALIALAVLLFGAVSRRLQTTVITAPMMFVVLGLLAGWDAFGLVQVDGQNATIRLLAELTLALVLYTDAARIDVRSLRHDMALPLRLLTLAFPLAMLAGAALAYWLFPGFSLWEAALIGIVLAPTDAALGRVVFSSKKVPGPIREALNVESGLNDGLAVPAVLIALSFAGAAAGSGESGRLSLVLRPLLLAPVIGVGVAYLGGWLVDRSSRATWMSDTFRKLSAMALALLAFAAAELAGASGFIAAFCAGLTMGNIHRRLRSHLNEFAEAEGQLLSLITFMMLGGFLVEPILATLGAREWLYAALSLTVVRMVPVAVALVGSGLSGRAMLLVGWFGPRGLASIVFAVLVAEQHALPHADAIFAIAIGTVILSVFAHGLTAMPGVRMFSRAQL